MNPQYSFPKEEHLCGDICVNRLFTEGKAFIAYPLRVVYLFQQPDSDVSIRVMVSVPKKRFKRAVKRNRLKRLMREAYRLNKADLTVILQEKQLQAHIAFNYVGNELCDFQQIERKMKSALEKVAAPLKNNSSETL